MLTLIIISHRYKISAIGNKNIRHTQISSCAIAKFPVAQARCNGVRKSSELTETFMSSQLHLIRQSVNARISPLNYEIIRY